MNTPEESRFLPPLLHPASAAAIGLSDLEPIEGLALGPDIVGARVVVGRTGDPGGFSAFIGEACKQAKENGERVVDIELALDGAMVVALLAVERDDEKGETR